MAKVYTYERLIQKEDIDRFDHVNNAAYLKIYEEARWHFIEHNGYGFDVIQAKGLGPVVLEVNLKFKKEIKLNESIVVHSQTRFFKGKVGQMNQWITNKNNELCSSAIFTIGFWNVDERKLVTATSDWLLAIGL